MEATIKVIVGLTDPLERLATEALQLWKLNKDPLAPLQVTQNDVPKQTPALEEPEKTTRIEKPAPQPEPLDIESVEPAPAPQPEPEKETEKVTPVELPPDSAPDDAIPVPPPNDETLRTMLDICITKWAGLGSESSKDPMVLLKRKDVCNCFKEIARHLGAEKPTKLQGEKRMQFIEAIETQLAQEGDRIIWLPF